MMQPFSGAEEFLGQPQIDEVPGDGNVVGLPLDEVAGQHVEHVAPMHELAPAMPIDVSEHTLAHEIAALGPRHGA
jgi:hypothetical protein